MKTWADPSLFGHLQSPLWQITPYLLLITPQLVQLPTHLGHIIPQLGRLPTPLGHITPYLGHLRSTLGHLKIPLGLDSSPWPLAYSAWT